MQGPTMIRQTFKLLRLAQGRENADASVADDEFKVAAPRLKRDDPRRRPARMLVDVRFHLTDGCGQALRRRDGEAHRLRRPARRYQELRARQIIPRVQGVEYRPQEPAVLDGIKPKILRTEQRRS